MTGSPHVRRHGLRLGDDTYGELGNGLAGNACSGTLPGCPRHALSPSPFPTGSPCRAIAGGGAFALAKDVGRHGLRLG